MALAMAMASTSGMSMATASGLASSFCTTTRSAALSSRGSELRGLHFAASSSSSSACCSAPSPLLVQPIAKRVCDLTGKKANNGYKVSFSNHRTKKLQGVNLQYKRLWWEEKKRFVRLRISTKALKTIEKKGLSVMAKEAGIDLNQY